MSKVCYFLIGPSLKSLLDSTSHIHKLKKLIILFGRHYELTYNKKPCLLKVKNHFKICKKMYQQIFNSPKYKKNVSFLRCKKMKVGGDEIEF